MPSAGLHHWSPPPVRAKQLFEPAERDAKERENAMTTSREIRLKSRPVGVPTPTISNWPR